MTQHVSSIALITAVLLSAGACESGDPGELTEQEELQALLRDAPLTQVPPGASLTTAAARTSTSEGDDPIAIASGPPLGSWNFDDCNEDRTQLFDSSGFDNTAYRSVNVACAEGAHGQGVAIAAAEDIVYVPDQPDFTFEEGVTVAGWFKPVTVGGTRTLFRKRDKETSSFALLLNGGRFQFVISLGDGRAISVTSPRRARPGVFQHVAGTYDGDTLRLYVDGLEVTSFTLAGTIPIGPGPVLMGNDGSERRFNGSIDRTLFATHALDPDEILALTCLPQQPTMVVSPDFIEDAPIGVPVTIDVALTNNNPAVCAPLTFTLEIFDNEQLIIDPPPFNPIDSEPVASGETGHFTITVTASEFATPGDTTFLDFQIFEPVTDFFDFGFVEIIIGEGGSGCRVSTPRELMIRDLSVVDDPLRTGFDPDSSDPRNGVWTFKHLMENMAPTPEDAPAMVEAVMTSFTTTQTINGFAVEERPGFQDTVLDNWPRSPDGSLDLARAPLRLQAIVNRFDLRNLANGDAGEGRFVFAFQDPFDPESPLQATLIVEYKLPAANDAELLAWAQEFHALGALSFGEEYNAALQAITERFVGRGARPGHINGSALNALRTNEIAFGGIWELREFDLSPASGLLEPTTVDLTPDGSFDNTDTLAAYIAANQGAILVDRHVVPLTFDGQPFQGGAIFNELTTWFAPDVDPEARHHFAINTCNGCHSSQETNTTFLQIEPRFPGSQAGLSGFLTGTIVEDPQTGELRSFNDLARRNADLRAIVCTEEGARSSAWDASLRKGITRVH